MNLAKVVHGIISPLWPFLGPGSCGVDIGKTAWLGVEGINGACLDTVDRVLLHRYIAATAPDHPAWQLATEETCGPRYILIVDYESAQRTGGFVSALRIALHQQAHAIRSMLADSGFFPHATRLMQIDAFLQSRAKAAEGTGESWMVPPPLMPQPDETDIHTVSMPPTDRSLGDDSLLQEWAADADGCDQGHDLLFSLLFDRLKRMADERGAFSSERPLQRSAFIPIRTGSMSPIMRK